MNLPIGARRIVASHCPNCGKPHDGEPYRVGIWWAPDDLTRNIVYGLCFSCGQRMDKAGKRGRKRILTRIEKSLEEAGILEDLRKEGMRA